MSLSIPLVDRSSSRLKTCNFCETTNEKNKRCSQCKAVFYCGKTCQAKDWKKHKKFCKAPDGPTTQKIQNLQSSFLPSIAESPEQDDIWEILQKKSKTWPKRETHSNAEAWNLLGPTVDMLPSNHGPKINESVVRRWEKKPGSPLVFIDLGAGNAENAKLCLEKGTGWEVKVVDFSHHAIQKIQKELPKSDARVEIVYQDICEYTFPEKSDFIAAFDVAEYCDPGKLKTLLRKIYNSLEPLGCLVITFPCELSLGNTLTISLGPLLKGVNSWYFDQAKHAVDALQQSGFTVIASQKSPILGNPVWYFVGVKRPARISDKDFQKEVFSRFCVQ